MVKMIKPTIEHWVDGWDEGILVERPNGGYLEYRDVWDSYENMMDSLILVMSIYKDYKHPEDIGNVLHENIETIEQALKKAGCK